jgi:adenylate cyclase
MSSHKEIERRFLVSTENFYKILTEDMQTDMIQQAYLKSEPGVIDRIRICNGKAIRTTKSNFNGISCDEDEHEVPLDDGKRMFVKAIRADASGGITKTRTIIPFGELKIEVDEFAYPLNLSGLIIAEIELPSEDHSFEVPEWFGEEISGRRGWNNFSLLKNGIPNETKEHLAGI